jgi:hypothetical protein
MMRSSTAALVLLAAVSAVEARDGRWALSRDACDGEAHTRRETPLISEGLAVRWFASDCTVVSSYKVGQASFLQARCVTEGVARTIPIMLELRGERLRVGWAKEPVVEMERCP